MPPLPSQKAGLPTLNDCGDHQFKFINISWYDSRLNLADLLILTEEHFSDQQSYEPCLVVHLDNLRPVYLTGIPTDSNMLPKKSNQELVMQPVAGSILVLGIRIAEIKETVDSLLPDTPAEEVDLRILSPNIHLMHLVS